MKNRISRLFENLAAAIRRIFGVGAQPQAKTRCTFCGETGHTESDCPNAGKYKLFNVDRE